MNLWGKLSEIWMGIAESRFLAAADPVLSRHRLMSHRGAKSHHRQPRSSLPKTAAKWTVLPIVFVVRRSVNERPERICGEIGQEGNVFCDHRPSSPGKAKELERTNGWTNIFLIHHRLISPTLIWGEKAKHYSPVSARC